MSALEDRLARLDLQLAPVGEHLDANVLASVAQGSEPTAAEAAHLAACDECTELLIVAGVGLEAALVDLPDASSWVRPPQPAPSGGGLSLLLGGGALVLSAAALWVALGTRDEPATTPPPAPAPITVQSDLSQGSRSSVANDRESTRRSEPTVAPVSVAAPPSAAPPIAAPPSRASAPKARRVAPRPRPAVIPDTQMRVRGPRALAARPVDGPPRGNGYLRLNTKPPAKVYIDGTLIGWTPLLDHRLLEGPHDVRLVYESPQAREREERFRVVIEPDRVWRSLRRNLRR